MKGKLTACSTLAFIALSQPLLALAQQAQSQQAPLNWPGPWHMWGDGSGYWWMFPLMLLFMLLVCVAFLLLAHRSAGGLRRKLEGPADSALRILNERFARGEIQKDEYQERKAALLTIMAPGGQA